MLNENTKYSYNDIVIEPAKITDITHRNECNPFLEDGKFPIFTAPMSTVVNVENLEIFKENKITPILPRNISTEIRIEKALNGEWVAFSLNEFTEHFVKNPLQCDKTMYTLIDIANGHIKALYDTVRGSKAIYGDNIKVMIGNIANPNSYEDVCECGADYVRLGIGGGSGCITSSNTGVHFPMASLVYETFLVKQKMSKFLDIPFEKLPKIIADGGIRSFRDINKALALGADYVMIGGFLSSCLESAGSTFYLDKDNNKHDISNNISEYTIKSGIVYRFGEPTTLSLKKQFYGMASKLGQIDMNGTATKTSEGIERIYDVKYTVQSWVENMKSYLLSGMSYTNSKDITDFNPFNVTTCVQSNNSFLAVNK